MTKISMSPEIIALGYYDGPKNGFLRFSETNEEYYFACFATILLEENDLSGFKLFPLPTGTFDELCAKLLIEKSPKQVHIVSWKFSRKAEEEVLQNFIDELKNRKGAISMAIAWYVSKCIIAEKSIHLDDEVLLVKWLMELDSYSQMGTVISEDKYSK